MTTKKILRLGDQTGSVEASASRRKDSPSPEDDASVVPTSVRLPKATHEILRKLAFDLRVPIHSLILEGIEKVIKEKG